MTRYRFVVRETRIVEVVCMVKADSLEQARERVISNDADEEEEDPLQDIEMVQREILSERTL